MKTGTCPLPSSLGAEQAGDPTTPSDSPRDQARWREGHFRSPAPSSSSRRPAPGGHGFAPGGWVPQAPRGSLLKCRFLGQAASFYFTKFGEPAPYLHF